MKTTHVFTSTDCMYSWMQSQSQQTKSPVQLADQYFAAGEYYTAAHLYGQYLNPLKKAKEQQLVFL